MEDDGAAELEGERELRGEEFAHLARDRLLLQSVEPDLADAEPRIRRELFAKVVHPLFNFSTFPLFHIPGMDADEVAPDQELANGRIAAADVAMRVGHIRMRSASAFSSSMSPLWFSNTIGSCP